MRDERGERREERGERRSSKKNDDTCKMKSMARGRNVCCYTGTPHNGLHQRPPLHRRHPLRCAPQRLQVPRPRVEWAGPAKYFGPHLNYLGPHLNYLGPHLNCLGHLLNYVGQHLNYLGHRDRGGVPFVRRQTRSIGVPMRCFDVSRCMNLDIAFGVPSAVSLRTPCMVSTNIKPHAGPSASARF